MQTAKYTSLFAALACCVLMVAPAVAGPTEKILYSFKGGSSDGSVPQGGPIMDAAGNLYGVTTAGGNPACLEGCGVVYEVSPVANGSWTEKVLHTFSLGTDGVFPEAQLLMDQHGNLYGTTTAGGRDLNGECASYGCGTVFELTPKADGKWKEKVLLSFDAKNGAAPVAGVTMDAQGNLYGTALDGGKYGYGLVYKLSPKANGKWTETVLHEFRFAKDGGYPGYELIFDKSGNLISAASPGNRQGGLVFQLIPQADGSWKEKTVYYFDRSDSGAIDPVFDSSGNLVIPIDSQEKPCEVVRLTLSGERWTQTVLHRFTGKNGRYSGGQWISGNVIFDPAGNIYGLTQVGGTYAYGTAFELMQENGKWRERVLHTFLNGKDAAYPTGAPVFDKAGNLYGAARGGGQTGNGSVFEIIP